MVDAIDVIPFSAAAAAKRDFDFLRGGVQLAAGLDDGDIAEVIANVALNLFTNYFNNFNQSEVDLPKVPVNIA